MEESFLFRRIYGCLIGGALGDAMGRPVEGMPYKEIWKTYGKVKSVRDPRLKTGVYTDDTKLKHLLCKAIIQKGGRITIEDFAEVWVNEMNPREFWISEQLPYFKLKMGASPRGVSEGNVPADDAAMMIAPIGLINAGNPGQAAQDAYNVASICQRGHPLASAVAVAAAVAEALNPEASIDSVIEASMKWTDKRNVVAIEKAIALAKECGDVFEVTEKFYERLLGESLVDPLEVVSAALAMFYKSNGDPEGAIIGGVNFGRDADTVAGIAGGIAGAFKGIEAISPDFVKLVEEANPTPNMRELASGILKAVENTLHELEREASILRKLLSAK